jgi:hypothetical protein
VDERYPRLTHAAASLVLALVVATLFLAPGARAAVPAEFFGVMADGPMEGRVNITREFRLMRSVGGRTTRVAFYWDAAQPYKGDEIFYNTYDRVVLAAARGGVRVLPVVLRTPRWAASSSSRAAPPRDPDDYGRFLGLLVRRYGPGGSFWREHPEVRALPVRAWQVWNEPDKRKFWSVQPWAASYTRLLRAARFAIKAADPGASVVMAGLTNRSWEGIVKLYRAGGGPLFDQAAVHPFSRRISNVMKIVGRVRAAMARRGDRNKPLMLTEVSWTSAKGKAKVRYSWETTERGQATKLRQAFTTLAKARRRHRLSAVYWYTWLSPRIGGRNSFSYAGLRRIGKGGKPVSKPALRAFKSTVARLRR